MLHISTEMIENAVSVLKEGGVIVYPTETSYGLGCDAENPEAVARIFAIKGRSSMKGLPLIIPDKESAGKYVVLSEKARQITDVFWPGPLNVIAPIADGSRIAPACAQGDTQSVRVSSHPFAATLARQFGGPITATSANISGQDAIYSVVDVERVFKDQPDKPDLVIDGGELPVVEASTTVRVVGDLAEVVRPGRIDVSSMV